MATAEPSSEHRSMDTGWTKGQASQGLISLEFKSVVKRTEADVILTQSPLTCGSAFSAPQGPVLSIVHVHSGALGMGRAVERLSSQRES